MDTTDSRPEAAQAERDRQLHTHLIDLGNKLLDAGFTPAEISSGALGLAIIIGQTIDPVGMGERCLAAARVLANRAQAIAVGGSANSLH